MNDEVETVKAGHLITKPVVRGVADEETLFKLLLGGTTNVRAAGDVFDLIQYMQSFWPDPVLRGQSKTRTLAALVSYGIRSLPGSLQIDADFELWKAEVRTAQAKILAKRKAADEKRNGVKVPLLDLDAIITEPTEVGSVMIATTIDSSG